MWGPYLVHKHLMIDKQIEHAVDYYSKALIEGVAHMGEWSFFIFFLDVWDILVRFV